MVCKLCYNLQCCCISNSYIHNSWNKSLCSCSYFSTQDNAKLLPQLKSSFKRTISWNKYLSKQELLRQNPNLNHLVESCFQGVNRLFVLAFENDAQRTSNKRYYLPNVEIKDNNVMIDGKNVFDQSTNSDLKT